MARVARQNDDPHSNNSNLFSRVKSMSKRAASPALELLRSASNSATSITAVRIVTPHQVSGLSSQAYTIAPTTHRENTALHALLDTLPTLPTFPSLSLPSFGSTSYKPAVTTPPIDENSSDEYAHNLQSGSKSSPGVNPRRGSSSHSDDPIKRLTGSFLTLGGYRGSILRDSKTNRRVWVPFKAGFKIRRPDLALGLEDEDEFTSNIIPGKQLMQIGPIDLGKRLKDRLKVLEASQASGPSHPAAGGVPPAPFHFVNHGYDWRRRLELSSVELLSRLTALKAESPTNEGATVMAHSMGGLVALHALATAPDPTVFKGLILAGTPCQGTVNVLSPFRYGDGVLFNREICAPAVVFSMRSSFYFLPQTGLCFETPEGAPLPVDFYDPHSWSTYNLSPVTAGLYQSPQDANPAGSAAPGLDKLAVENQHRETGKSAQDQARDRHAEMHGRGADEATSWGAGAVLGLGSAPPPSHSTPVSTSSDEAGRRRGVSITSGKTIRTPKCENEGEVYPDRGTESQQSRQNTTGDEEDDDDEDGDDPNPTPPDFAELEKVLSSSDAAISNYLTKTLNRVKQFYTDIETGYSESKRALYPPIVVLTSRKTATVRGVMTSSRSTIATEPYKDLLWDEGDGIVLYNSATRLPGSTTAWQSHVKAIVESAHGHVSLLGDLDAVRKCLVALYG